MELRRIIGKPSVRECEFCGALAGVTYRAAMTAYHFEGEYGSDEDPNRPLPMCDGCWERYFEYWDGRWQEYRSSQGI